MNFLKRFLKKDNQVRNIYHPDIRDKVEKAFTLEGVDYYRYKEDLNMHEMRRFEKLICLTELENGVTHDDLLAYIDAMEDKVNKGKLGDVAMNLTLLRQRVKIAKDPDTFYKIATVDFFDDNEELTHYDREYNRGKLAKFKASKDLSFFLTRPMIDIFPQLANLVLDSEAFSKEITDMRDMKEKIDSLILEPSFKKKSTISGEN